MAYRTSSVGKSVVARLGSQGFALPDKPSLDSVPSLPTDLTELSDEELMETFALFTAWCDYASAQVGLAVIAEREAERHREEAEGKAWLNIPPKSSVSASKGLVAADPGVVEATFLVDEAHAYRRMVAELAARYERDAAVMSREITRRTNDGPGRKRYDRGRT